MFASGATRHTIPDPPQAADVFRGSSEELGGTDSRGDARGEVEAWGLSGGFEGCSFRTRVMLVPWGYRGQCVACDVPAEQGLGCVRSIAGSPPPPR